MAELLKKVFTNHLIPTIRGLELDLLCNFSHCCNDMSHKHSIAHFLVVLVNLLVVVASHDFVHHFGWSSYCR